MRFDLACLSSTNSASITVQGGGCQIKTENLSKKVAAKVGEVLELTPERRDVVDYGLSVLISNTLGIAVTLLIAHVMGSLIPTLAMIATLLVLRPSAGGAHCSSSFNCSLFGYILIPLFGYGALWLSRQDPPVYQYIYLICCALTVVLGIAMNAPYFTIDKPRAVARRKQLKARALALALLAALTSAALLLYQETQWSMGIATGLLFQGAALSGPGIKGIQFFDALTIKLFQKGVN